jgi:beta-galactosidase
MGPNLPGWDVTVDMTESLPPSTDEPLDEGRFIKGFEHLEGTAAVLRQTRIGRAAIMGGPHLRYLAGWPDHDTFAAIVRDLCIEQDIQAHNLPDGLRIRDTDRYRFVFNYAAILQNWNGINIPPAGVHWEKR